MLIKRKFSVVVVKEGVATGVETATKFDKVISYDGKAVSVKIQ